MDVEILSTLVDLGTSAVLIFILSRVWEELKASNAFIRDLLLKQQTAERDRDEIRDELNNMKRINPQWFMAQSENEKNKPSADRNRG